MPSTGRSRDIRLQSDPKLNVGWRMQRVERQRRLQFLRRKRSSSSPGAPRQRTRGTRLQMQMWMPCCGLTSQAVPSVRGWYYPEGTPPAAAMLSRGGSHLEGSSPAAAICRGRTTSTEVADQVPHTRPDGAQGATSVPEGGQKATQTNPGVSNRKTP